MTPTVFAVGPLEENAYLLVDEQAGEAVFVDPGDEGARLVQAVRDAGVPLTQIWLTHAHFDHVGAVAELRRAWPDAVIRMHPADQPLYALAAQSAARWGLEVENPPPVDAPIVEGEPLRVGRYTFDVLHTPGTCTRPRDHPRSRHRARGRLPVRRLGGPHGPAVLGRARARRVAGPHREARRPRRGCCPDTVRRRPSPVSWPAIPS